eukprot:7378932-Prymnesium_polylepis.2
MINTIASVEVRELLHELSKPHVCLALCVFELYGTGGRDKADAEDEAEDGSDEARDGEGDDGAGDGEGGRDVAHEHSLRRFLNFTQDDSEGVFFRVHRRVRRRLRYLSALASEDEDDGGEYYKHTCHMLLDYVASCDDAFDDIDVRKTVQLTFSKAHDFFEGGIERYESSPGTKFLFAHPVYLCAGMLDEG